MSSSPFTPVQAIDLKRLSEHQGTELAFLSVYVCGEAGRQALPHRLERLAALLDDDDEAEALEHFQQNARLVEEWLDRHPAGEGTACVFACYALDLCQGWQVDFELPTDVRVGVAPYVRPLAELQDENETFAVVAADNTATRVYLITGAQEEVAGRIRGDIKNHVRKGGWSQKRYERRREEALRHYATDVAAYLERLLRREPFDRLVLVGSEETVVAIEHDLDAALRERLVARDSMDLKEGQEAVVAEAFEHYRHAERQAEQRLWQRIRGEYRSGGLAVVGGEDVLEAVQTGRADAILVERDCELPGRRCGHCENAMAGAPEQCQYCGSDSLLKLDLVNEITRHAELTGATVDFADPLERLSRVGHIAALLRY